MINDMNSWNSMMRNDLMIGNDYGELRLTFMLSSSFMPFYLFYVKITFLFFRVLSIGQMQIAMNQNSAILAKYSSA